MILISYRSYYKSSKPIVQAKNTLKSELENLQRELQELQTRSIPIRQNNYNNFAELESFFMNKFILIGGSILIGLGIGYLIFSKKRSRC